MDLRGVMCFHSLFRKINFVMHVKVTAMRIKQRGK
jgi:hypothetical protein